ECSAQPPSGVVTRNHDRNVRHKTPPQLSGSLLPVANLGDLLQGVEVWFAERPNAPRHEQTCLDLEFSARAGIGRAPHVLDVRSQLLTVSRIKELARTRGLLAMGRQI